MSQRINPFVALGFLGACALACPRDAHAGKGVTGTVTVQPTGDPVGYYNGSFTFTPDTGEYFAPNPAYPAAPTDFFTLTGFGTLVGINSLNLVDFSYDASLSTPTVLQFDYTGATDLTSMTSLGTISFTATATNPSTLTISYQDSMAGSTGPNTGTNSVPVTVVPEPTTIALLGLGAVGGLVFRRRLSRRLA